MIVEHNREPVMPPDHPHQVAQFLAEVFGGPTAYTAEHGGPYRPPQS